MIPTQSPDSEVQHFSFEDLSTIGCDVTKNKVLFMSYHPNPTKQNRFPVKEAPAIYLGADSGYLKFLFVDDVELNCHTILRFYLRKYFGYENGMISSGATIAFCIDGRTIAGLSSSDGTFKAFSMSLSAKDFPSLQCFVHLQHHFWCKDKED